MVTFCSGHSSGTQTIARILRHAPRLAVISAPTRKRTFVSLPSLVLLSVAIFGAEAVVELVALGAASRVAVSSKRIAGARQVRRKQMCVTMLLLYFGGAA